MIQHKLIIKALLLVLIGIVSTTFLSCESDPILSPQVEAEDDGGSYGNTNLPVNTSGNTENTGNDTINEKIQKIQKQKKNPKLF